MGKRSSNQGQGSGGHLRPPAGLQGLQGVEGVISVPKLTNFCILISNIHAFCMTFIIDNQFLWLFLKIRDKVRPGKGMTGIYARRILTYNHVG